MKHKNTCKAHGTVLVRRVWLLAEREVLLCCLWERSSVSSVQRRATLLASQAELCEFGGKNKMQVPTAVIALWLTLVAT